MKKEILRMLALLLFGAAALSGCAVNNHHRGQYDRHNDRGHYDHGHDDDHHYNNHGGY